jgi:hypothetical protein
MKQTVFSQVAAGSTVEDTIAVFGAPHSGTTWLAEILRSLPRYKFLNEPIWHSNHHSLKRWPYLEPEERDTDRAKRVESYLKGILRGKVGISPMWRFAAKSQLGKLIEHATHDRLIVKFTRLNRSISWFTRRFDVRQVFLIVRHPCAVVASAMRKGNWHEKPLAAALDSVGLANLPVPLREKFIPLLESAESPEEARAVQWCVDHYVPLLLHEEREYPWVTLSYERLLLQGGQEIDRIGELLNENKATKYMKERLGIPSGSVVDSPEEKETRQQLSKWRKRLSSGHIQRIMEIVEACGLDQFYTSDMEPKHESLNPSL